MAYEIILLPHRGNAHPYSLKEFQAVFFLYPVFSGKFSKNPGRKPNDCN